MNNSVYGKTQDNLKNRVHVEMVTDARLLRKRTEVALLLTVLLSCSVEWRLLR